jgi:hypothetical protein
MYNFPKNLILLVATLLLQTIMTTMTTHKQKLQNVHKEMRDLIQKSKDAPEDEWILKESNHSQTFWGDYNSNNIEWTDIFHYQYYYETWFEWLACQIQKDSIISLWTLGSDYDDPPNEDTHIHKGFIGNWKDEIVRSAKVWDLEESYYEQENIPIRIR